MGTERSVVLIKARITLGQAVPILGDAISGDAIRETRFGKAIRETRFGRRFGHNSNSEGRYALSFPRI